MRKTLNNASKLAVIRKKLGHAPLIWKPTTWLDTKVAGLNPVLGHREKGIPYGRMLEVFGWSSQGKSSIVMSLAALMQRDGAFVVLGDIENSFEADYARARGLIACSACQGTLFTGKGKDRKECTACVFQQEPSGLDFERLMVIKPYVGEFADIDPVTKRPKKVTRLANAQELCAEIEEAIQLKVPQDRKVIILDSVAAMLTAGEQQAGLNGGMRSNMELPLFMGKLLRRWVGLAQVHNAVILLVNQLRTGPKSFGNPEYTPGGNAAMFYSHVRVQVKRITGSRIKDKGRTVGIKGKLVCVKNKTGGEEGAEIGFKLMFKGGLEFLTVKSLNEETA
jgi:recombination protein RecA